MGTTKPHTPPTRLAVEDAGGVDDSLVAVWLAVRSGGGCLGVAAEDVGEVDVEEVAVGAQQHVVQVPVPDAHQVRDLRERERERENERKRERVCVRERERERERGIGENKRERGIGEKKRERERTNGEKEIKSHIERERER